jgi:hypothetical protein
MPKFPKTTYSNRTEWTGFEPRDYTLDWRKILALPFTEVRKRDDETEELIPISVREINRLLGQKKIESAESHLDTSAGKVDHAVTIVADGVEMNFRSESFNCHLLATIVTLDMEGINPSSTQWFFYDADECTDEPHASYEFFVTSGNRIVRERCLFFDARGNGFDPTVFVADDSETSWSNDKFWKDAQVRHWYRKFYTETEIGRLMVLRSDAPKLFHYPEGERIASLLNFADDPTLSEMAGTEKALERIRILLVILVLLSIIQLALRWL